MTLSERAASGRQRIDVHPSDERFSTRLDWLHSRHSFAFGSHHDPSNTHFGLLVVHNEDVLAEGGAFADHAHRDMEILTWVLSGVIVHEDSEGHSGAIHPGLVQRVSAGSGIRHSERASGDFAHYIQMWLLPDERGIRPSYQQAEIDVDALAGHLLPIASGMAAHLGEALITLNNASAAFHVARLTPGQQVLLPDAPYVHLFLAHGLAALEGSSELSTGDAARISAEGGQRLTAIDSCEILLWEMHAARR